MDNLRVFFLGGLTSYRALFNWLTPWILVPTFIVAPVTQILLFVYVGRDTATASDTFFVIGNAVQYTAVPCLFASASMVTGERYSQTLSAVLVTPARRVPLVLGRSLPVLMNGFVVSVIALLAGGAMVGVRLTPARYGLVLVAMGVSSFACTGLGLIAAAIGLRVQQTAVLSSFIVGLLLLFCGVNLPTDDMPSWMAGIGRWLPLTHGVEAARAMAGGATFGHVRGLLATELALGTGYFLLGLLVLDVFERQSRRTGSLDRF